MVNSLQSTLISRVATTADHVLAVRYTDKMTKHGEGCRLAGRVFIPMVVETLGGWQESAVLMIKRIKNSPR